MKKVLLTAFAVMASLSLFAQGTIDFKNNSASSVMIKNADGSTSKAGNDCYVGLWYGAANSTDDSTFTFLASGKLIGSGIFSLGTKTIASPFVGGSQVAVEVRGWQGPATTWADAVAGGAKRDQSAIFNMATGAPAGSPPTSPIGITPGFTGLTLQVQVPEPSTIALGLLGLGGLFLLRRRS